MTSPDDVVLTLSHVAVSFGSRTVLDDVSFEVRRGEFTGLIGANGVGKTTLLRVILGSVRPRSGSVTIAAPPTGGRAVGYVPQKVILDRDAPVRARDLVALGLDGERWGLRRRSPAERARIDEVLHAVGAVHLADRRVGRLSGGEQQRVLIAHALVARPAVLLLDEPLANLDPRAVHDVVALLRGLARDNDVAVLLSAHDMNALLPVMDRVVYLADGRAASGTTDEVVRTDVLSSLYGHHVDVLRLHGRVLVVPDPRAELIDLPAHGPMDVDG